ncbi:MAG: hypothetical protein ACU0GG_04135 [Paracoccaceae bacterium]
MTTQARPIAVDAASAIIAELEQMGMRLEIGDDFSKYRRYRMAQSERAPMYPMFDVTRSYIDDTNGVWICGFDDAGTLVHTQAARMLDLTDRSLDRHLSIHRHKYITPMTTIDPDRTYFKGPDGLGHITGKVCYNGDFWMMARGLGGNRSRLAITLLSRLLLQLVMDRWAPDYSFAFLSSRLAKKGLYKQYGYTHCERGAWSASAPDPVGEEYLAWMTNDDILNLLACTMPSFSDLKLRAA